MASPLDALGALDLDDDKGPVIIGVTSMFWSIALVIVLLRFWTAYLCKRKVLIHDYLIILAFVSCFSPTAASSYFGRVTLVAYVKKRNVEATIGV